MPLHNTRGAASATGFGFGASTGGPDWSKYAMIPFNTTDNARANTVAFLNVAANTIDYYVSFPSTSVTNLMRMGNYLVCGTDNCGFYMMDIRTNTLVQSIVYPFETTTQGDFFKFGLDKFGVMTKIGSQFQIATLKVNANGSTSIITWNTSVDTWGAQTGYSSPKGAAIVTCDAKGMFESFSGKVAFRSIYSYTGGATTSVNGNVSISQDGTSIAMYNGSTDGGNFSRPSACSGGYGASIIYDMDHSSYYISQGSETTMSGYTASGGGTPTNFRGCGITLSQAFLNMGWDYGSSAYIRRMTYGGGTTPLSFSVYNGIFSGTMQMYGDGAFFAYNNGSNLPVYQTYSSIYNSFSGEIGIPSFGYYAINKYGQIYGTYNF
jgi:hypothetical protein